MSTFKNINTKNSRNVRIGYSKIRKSLKIYPGEIPHILAMSEQEASLGSWSIINSVSVVDFLEYLLTTELFS